MITSELSKPPAERKNAAKTETEDVPDDKDADEDAHKDEVVLVAQDVAVEDPVRVFHCTGGRLGDTFRISGLLWLR